MANSFEPRFEDLVRNYTTTEGTGNIVPGPAVAGYRSFASALQAGDRFYYSVIGVEIPGDSEVGRGTMLADGTIGREPIDGVLTNFTGGTKTVALIAAAEWYSSVHAGGLAAAATRTELAALSPSKPAILKEPLRTGLFVFDPADLRAEVTADPAQAIYVASSTDPTGAGGAWVRKYSGALDVRWFGATGEGVVDDTAGIQAALDYLQAIGGGELKLGMGKFPVTGTLLLFAADAVIDAKGATLIASDTTSIPMFYVGGDRARIVGGTWKVPFAAARQFDVEGKNCRFDGCIIEHDPVADTVQMYIRSVANGFQMTNCRLSGANEGMFLEASNVLIMGNEFLGAETVGPDDAIAIKAIQGITENIRIIGNQFRRHAAIVSVGSEIGLVGVDDPNYTRRVRNVAVVGNIAERCVYGLFIKPGAVAADYRNGTVENICFSDNVLYDRDGNLFERAIAITAGRGAVVRNVYGDNNLVVARTSGTDATGHKVAMDIFSPTGLATFENIDVELIYRDPYGGVAFGTVNTSGYPVSNFVNVEPNGATLRDINLRIVASGCAGAGIYIGPGVDDAVTISRAKLDRVNVAATASGGITTHSRIRVRDDVSISMASGNPYKLVTGTSAEILSNAETVFFAENIAAGVDQIRRPWAAPRNAFVHRIELLSAKAISQSTDDTNYTQFELRNIGGNTNIFHTTSSKLTGGEAFPADRFNALMRAKDVTNPTYQTQCFFVRDSLLYVHKNDFGTGNLVSLAYMRIHWAPY